MNRTPRSLLAAFTLATIVPAAAFVPIRAEVAAVSQLQGLVISVDGRPAGRHAVHLIDAGGRDVARAAVSDEGVYSFSGLPAGKYSLGIESPQGQMAPVAARPIEVGGAQLARRDIKLLQADPDRQLQVVGANQSMGVWWAGLTTPAKVWTIIGIVAVAGITVAALSDDDDPAPGDGERPPSDF